MVSGEPYLFMILWFNFTAKEGRQAWKIWILVHENED